MLDLNHDGKGSSRFRVFGDNNDSTRFEFGLETKIVEKVICCLIQWGGVE